MSTKNKTFPCKRAGRPLRDVSLGAHSPGFSDAQSLEEAMSSARKINSRVRRDRKEAKAAAKDAYLAALLPRWGGA